MPIGYVNPLANPYVPQNTELMERKLAQLQQRQDVAEEMMAKQRQAGLAAENVTPELREMYLQWQQKNYNDMIDKTRGNFAKNYDQVLEAINADVANPYHNLNKFVTEQARLQQQAQLQGGADYLITNDVNEQVKSLITKDWMKNPADINYDALRHRGMMANEYDKNILAKYGDIAQTAIQRMHEGEYKPDAELEDKLRRYVSGSTKLSLADIEKIAADEKSGVYEAFLADNPTALIDYRTSVGGSGSYKPEGQNNIFADRKTFAKYFAGVLASKTRDIEKTGYEYMENRAYNPRGSGGYGSDTTTGDYDIQAGTDKNYNIPKGTPTVVANQLRGIQAKRDALYAQLSNYAPDSQEYKAIDSQIALLNNNYRIAANVHNNINEKVLNSKQGEKYKTALANRERLRSEVIATTGETTDFVLEKFDDLIMKNQLAFTDKGEGEKVGEQVFVRDFAPKKYGKNAQVYEDFYWDAAKAYGKNIFSKDLVASHNVYVDMNKKLERVKKEYPEKYKDFTFEEFNKYVKEKESFRSLGAKYSVEVANKGYKDYIKAYKQVRDEGLTLAPNEITFSAPAVVTDLNNKLENMNITNYDVLGQSEFDREKQAKLKGANSIVINGIEVKKSDLNTPKLSMGNADYGVPLGVILEDKNTGNSVTLVPKTGEIDDIVTFLSKASDGVFQGFYPKGIIANTVYQHVIGQANTEAKKRIAARK